MALRLGEYVVCGEIINTKNYSTHGWIGLRGRDQPLVLDLTGNCDPDLMSRHIRFEARFAEGESETMGPTIAKKGIAWEQVGPTGNMTATRRVKVPDRPVEELYELAKMGMMPELEWKNSIYLEWFSQNGRVVIELVDPVIEYVDGKPSAPREVDETPDFGKPPAGLSVTSIRLHDDGEVEIREEIVKSDEEREPEDPYGLVSNDFQNYLDDQSAATERALRSEEDSEDSDDIRELKLMDDLLERGEGEMICAMFDSPQTLPNPDTLNDDEIEGVFKSLLAQLALVGVAFGVCEHFTPREAYCVLLKEILWNQEAFPQLRNTQWVQHFMTHEYCPKCDEECQWDIEEFERKQKESGKADHPVDEDQPF